MPLKENDNRLKSRLGRLRSRKTSQPAKLTPSSCPPRYGRLARATGGELVAGEAGCFCLIKSLSIFGSGFGTQQLNPPAAIGSIRPSAFLIEGDHEAVDPGRLVFVDIETTGLGGAGTVPFLIGCGSVRSEGFEIRQYLLPDYSDEAAMLEAILAEFGPDKILVTYNGKAFDLPMIRDRMIINRVARQIPTADHYDLLPPTRRIYRRRLGSCKLTNIERELFDYHRQGDIPGYLIPSVYFEWLNSEVTAQMITVLEHNRLDILAMYFLLENLARVELTEGDSLESADDIFSLSRLYARRKDSLRLSKCLDRLGQSSDALQSVEIMYFRSITFKRGGRWSEALSIWEELAGGVGRAAFGASVQLAMYYEHRVKDISRAREYTSMAARNCPKTDTYQVSLAKRQARLERKRARSSPQV